MNKKVVFGCLGAFLLVMIAAGVGLYYFVWKPVSAVAGEAIDGVKSTVQGSIDAAQQLEALNQSIVNQGPFSPPSDGLLTQAQVDGLLAVHQSMRDGLGDKINLLEERYGGVAQTNPTAEPTFEDVSKAFTALKDLAGVIGETKKAQVAALNAQGWSLEEYRWVAATTFAAMTAGAAIEAAQAAAQSTDAIAKANEALKQATDAAQQIGQTLGQTPNTPAPAADPIPTDLAPPIALDDPALSANYALIRPQIEALAKGQLFALLPL
jgi:F0F1-type ATP synthase membrane subunit b/b'